MHLTLCALVSAWSKTPLPPDAAVTLGTKLDRPPTRLAPPALTWTQKPSPSTTLSWTLLSGKRLNSYYVRCTDKRRIDISRSSCEIRNSILYWYGVPLSITTFHNDPLNFTTRDGTSKFIGKKCFLFECEVLLRFSPGTHKPLPFATLSWTISSGRRLNSYYVRLYTWKTHWRN